MSVRNYWLKVALFTIPDRSESVNYKDLRQGNSEQKLKY
jgi:hypothetical protein